MNKAILNIEIQEFIKKNTHSNTSAILLKGTHFNLVHTKAIIEQIEARKKCQTKLPTWYNTKQIYYPNKLNIEQTSSEISANYKANLISGNSIIDVTGGFGVDSYYFSKQFKKVVHCEINEPLSNIVGFNYAQLDIQNIETLNTDGIDFLKTCNTLFDWIYIDPSRRHDSKGKVFFMNDCIPNVPESLDVLFEHSNNIMIKTSPLLDFSVGIGELKHVKNIHVVAINNEVKELLWILENGFIGPVHIQTVNIKKEANSHFDFFLETEKQTEAIYHAPLTYLYEPNAAILKAGGFHIVTKEFDVFKLHKHSHLYTSADPIDFPGRSFKIDNVLIYNKKELKKMGIKKANITTRNFPETVEYIRKKLSISEGGHTYLFFTTDLNDNKIVVIASKL